MPEWLYKQTEPNLWTVGHYDPHGTWDPDSDHRSSEEAAQRVRWLNGGGDEGAADRLAAMINGLQDHIEARAAEIAAPRIDAAQRECATQVSKADHRHAFERQRSEGLVAELRRQLASCDRTIKRLTEERDALRRDRDTQLWGVDQIQQANPFLRSPLQAREDDDA